MTKDAIRNLETALASAGSASSVLVDLTRAAARNAAGEMQAAEALRDIMTLKGSTSTSNGLAVDHLDEAIKRAARFPHLSVSAYPCTTSPGRLPWSLLVCPRLQIWITSLSMSLQRPWPAAPAVDFARRLVSQA